MVFQNRIDELDFPQQQQITLNILKEYIISKSITIIEQEDLFFDGATSHDKLELAMFRYKDEYEKFASHE